MILRTRRLALTPVGWADLPDLTALKTDPRAFAVMLGGVRGVADVHAELAADQAFWSRHGVGIWAVRTHQGAFAGLAGIMDRPDHRGLSLRFAIAAAEQGLGYAREAAAAALRDAMDRACLARVVAVTRADNYASRTVLGAIGMRVCERFARHDTAMLTYEATQPLER